MCRHVPRAGGAAGALADGLSDKEISENLHVGIGTVRNHLVSVFGGLGVNPLVFFALRQGVVQIA